MTEKALLPTGYLLMLTLWMWRYCQFDRLSLFIHCIVYCISTLWISYQSQVAMQSFIWYSWTQFSQMNWLQQIRRLNWIHHRHALVSFLALLWDVWMMFVSVFFMLIPNKTQWDHRAPWWSPKIKTHPLSFDAALVLWKNYWILFSLWVNALHLFLFFLFFQTLLQCISI